MSVRNLGYDYALKPHLAGRAKTRQARLAASAAKLSRARRLRLGPKRARRLVVAGSIPAALLGAEVTGASPAALKAFDAKVAKAAKIADRGNSLPIAWALGC